VSHKAWQITDITLTAKHDVLGDEQLRVDFCQPFFSPLFFFFFPFPLQDRRTSPLLAERTHAGKGVEAEQQRRLVPSYSLPFSSLFLPSLLKSKPSVLKFEKEKKNRIEYINLLQEAQNEPPFLSSSFFSFSFSFLISVEV